MTDRSRSNLFAEVPKRLADELTQVLLSADGIRIERIVSTAHRSPDGFWYDQSENEWVAVLRGEAKLRFDDESEPITLTPGDFLLIPANRRHRVESTSALEPTVWLAVFFSRSSINE